MFLGRVVEPGEPEWLPEDRDLVDMYVTEQKTRRSCGHFPWQEDEVAHLEPGYRVCAICAEMGPYEEKIRHQNRQRHEDQHGLTFSWHPPRGDDDGD